MGAFGLLAAAAWLLLSAVAPVPAGAVSDVEVGSWWVGQSSAGASPAPPYVPEDGLWIATNPNGATAMSAVRFTVPETESRPLLTLQIASQLPPGAGRLRACRITGDWQPVFVGPWSAQPTFADDDCAGGLLAGTVAQFDLGRFVTDGRVDVALVPVTEPSPPDLSGSPVPVPAVPGVPVPDLPPVFDLAFQPLQASSFAVTPAAPSAPAPAAPATTAVPAPVPAPAGPAASPVRPATAPAPAVPSAPVVPPSTPAAVQPVAPTITTDPVAFLRGEWRWARALAAAVLVGLAVWWLRVSAVGGRDEERSVLARRFPAGEGVAPALR